MKLTEKLKWKILGKRRGKQRTGAIAINVCAGASWRIGASYIAAPVRPAAELATTDARLKSLFYPRAWIETGPL